MGSTQFSSSSTDLIRINKSLLGLVKQKILTQILDELLLRGFNWLWLASDLLYRLIYEVNLQSTVRKIDSMVADRSCCLKRAWKIFMPSQPPPQIPNSCPWTTFHSNTALCTLHVLFLESDKGCHFPFGRQKNIKLMHRIIFYLFL